MADFSERAESGTTCTRAKTTNNCEDVSQTRSQDDHKAMRLFIPTTDQVIFAKRKDHYIAREPHRLKNSILAGIGLLELGNSGDFAANVWNEVPVKKWVMVLMALGATMALATCLCAVRDAPLCLENLRVLRMERQFLQAEQRRVRGNNKGYQRSLNAMLNVNFRELGTEILDRLIVDVLLGFGAFLICVGTYMAIGGDNHSVFIASNLLSGYIGNSAGALYGLLISGWSIYVSLRAHRHRSTITGQSKEVSNHSKYILTHRARKVQSHALILAVSALAAGAGGLISSTHWWGYIILLPCIITTFCLNLMFRHGVAYERPLATSIEESERLHIIDIDELSLQAELEYVEFATKCLASTPTVPADDPQSEGRIPLASLIHFMISIDIFESFCLRLLKKGLIPVKDRDSEKQELMTINKETLCNLEGNRSFVLDLALRHLKEKGLIQLRYRERYLVEVLGAYCCCVREERDVQDEESIHEEPKESV